MDLLSIFKRKTAGAAHAAPAESVQLARTRARRRLTGAAVLIVIGIIGFPMLFETQQRPIRVDVPIDIPRKDNVAPLVMPAPQRAASVTAPVASAPRSVARDEVITESKADAGSEIAPPARPVTTAAEKLKSNAAGGAPAVEKSGDASAKAARVQALLEGRPVSTAASPVAVGGARFVVQVGAFADAAAAREARLKLDGLSLKTYVQVANTTAGKLIRVRVGPYTTREEADKVAAKIRAKGAAPSAVVLTL